MTMENFKNDQLTSPKPQEKPDFEDDEISDEELDKVNGGTISHSTGAGAGKVSLNPFNITRKTDKASNQLF